MVGTVTETPAKPNRGRKAGSKPALQNPAAIIALRMERGLTPKQLAEESGISLSHMCLAEKGVSSLTSETLKRVADALGCPVARIVNPAAVGKAVASLLSEGDPASAGERPKRRKVA
jgi:transcriptional regulator with XRE-family HTH domain